MEILLIRHTTPAIDKGICYGQSDVGMTGTFTREARAIRQSLGRKTAGMAVYSSPLSRCVCLAAHLFKGGIITDPRLMELNFGRWELQRWDDMHAGTLQKWMKDFVRVRCPDGESYRDLYRRSVSFYEEVKKQRHKKTAVVCHAGVIRSILTHIHRIPLKDSFKLAAGYGSVTRLTVDREGNACAEYVKP